MLVFIMYKARETVISFKIDSNWSKSNKTESLSA